MWKIIKRLEKWPEVSGVKPLKGKLAGHSRIRTGDYRVVFTIREGKVIVEKVDHRRDVYRD